MDRPALWLGARVGVTAPTKCPVASKHECSHGGTSIGGASSGGTSSEEKHNETAV
jgi:hypothetical protein